MRAGNILHLATTLSLAWSVILKRIMAFAALSLCSAYHAAPLFAHPHLYVDTVLEFVADSNGLQGVAEEWRMGVGYSKQLISAFDEDGDGRLSPPERARLIDEAFAHLKEYAYFHKVVIDGTPFEPRDLERLDAAIENGRIVFRFYIPLRIPSTVHSVEFSISDDTNFVYFSLLNVSDPDGGDDMEYSTRIIAGINAFNPSLPSGQRAVEILGRRVRGSAPPVPDRPAYAHLSEIGPWRALREASNNNPFLTDPLFLGAFSPDNPITGFN